MKKYFILSIICAGILSLAATKTPLSTYVNESLRNMLNREGKFKEIITAEEGCTITGKLIGVSGDLADATGILATTKGGTGTNTATLAGFAHTGTSTFPSGIWASTGEVGIGTSTPATELHVIGTLTVSSGIVVAGNTMTVPDYVFDESYRLMPLDELQEYVEINKHLPAFQSEKNTKELNLVADNMALRRTIEELTLYILQIKNEINLLKLTNAD